MTCHVCKAQIASGSRFCSVCGSSTEPVVVAVGLSPGRTDALLAEANLYRLRAQWTEAEKRCVDVMRADGNNVAAHVLLGDICRDQGKADEARQWYQMGLDLDPENRAVQTKLRELPSARPHKPSSRPASAAPRSPSALPIGTQNLMGLSPSGWFRLIWVLCGVFVVVVACVVLWMRAHPRSLAYMPTGTIPGTTSDVPDAVKNLADGRLRTPDNSVTGTRYPPTVRPASGLGTPPGSVSASGQTPVSNPAASAAADSPEQAISAQIARSGALPPDVTLTGVRLDTGGRKATVSLFQRSTRPAIDPEARSAVVRAALVAAQSVFSADAACQTVTVEMRLGAANGQSQPLFAADIDRATSQRVDPTLRDEDRFSNAWWAPAQPAGEGEQQP